ncbi:MAG: nucleotidyltransferase family protein [Desulfuromonadaceae bacterium]
MTREEILDFLRQHKQEMNDRFGVTKIGLFGSYVRGEAREDSDIDIAVELEGDRLFRKFFALELFLKSNLQKNIDLGIESTLKSIVRERVAKEIQYV